MERIGILCSGGDSQGMNTCIKAIVNCCTAKNIIPIGISRGYQGLIDNDMFFLTREMVENIDIIGGSILKVSRSDEFLTENGLNKAVANLNKNLIDGLIILGGNGSFKGAENLVNKKIKLVAIPATIDNDLFYTERSLGFDTAVNNAVKAIDDILQSVSSNDRGMVVEVMGRNCGDIALYSALCVGASSVATKELKVGISQICEDVRKCISCGEKSPVVIISENVDFEVKDVELALQKKLKIDTRSTVLGYIQRGGAPSVFDRLLAIRFGTIAVESLLSNKFGIALGITGENIFAKNLKQANKAIQKFDYPLYDSLKQLHNLK